MFRNWNCNFDTVSNTVSTFEIILKVNIVCQRKLLPAQQWLKNKFLCKQSFVSFFIMEEKNLQNFLKRNRCTSVFGWCFTY